MSTVTIVRMKFGSHLYGTSTPESDVDLKSVFIPDGRSILMQSAARTISHARAKGVGEKNYAGEIDEEKISLQQFLKLLSEGQTMALDMLFAPGYAMMTVPSHEWTSIYYNRHRLLTRKSAAFIGYARQQANKYGIKGSRVAAARNALELLDQAMAYHGATEKLSVVHASIAALTEVSDHMSFMEDKTPHGQSIQLWCVCERKMPYTASIKNARDIMARVVDEYGRRAIMAETQQGVDWKALSHAVRVGTQAIELLNTGHITFPLPNAEHVIKIKTGQLKYQAVAEEIEQLLVDVEAAAEKSSLPDTPDIDWMNSFLIDAHYEAVKRWRN